MALLPHAHQLVVVEGQTPDDVTIYGVGCRCGFLYLPTFSRRDVDELLELGCGRAFSDPGLQAHVRAHYPYLIPAIDRALVGHAPQSARRRRRRHAGSAGEASREGARP